MGIPMYVPFILRGAGESFREHDRTLYVAFPAYPRGCGLGRCGKSWDFRRFKWFGPILGRTPDFLSPHDQAGHNLATKTIGFFYGFVKPRRGRYLWSSSSNSKSFLIW